MRFIRKMRAEPISFELSGLLALSIYVEARGAKALSKAIVNRLDTTTTTTAVAATTSKTKEDNKKAKDTRAN